MSQTELSRRLRGGEAPKPDALTAFDISRQWFTAGKKLDVGELSQELGVSRATLFRWVGNRDQLTAEIIADIAVKTFHEVAEENVGQVGPGRVAAVVGGFVRRIADAQYFIDFVHAEPEKAMRICTTKHFPVQRAVLVEVEKLLVEELPPADGTSDKLSHHDLAYLVVRIAESVLYTDVISGEPPHPEISEQAVRALVR
jgi:AcrR family transcriptional regulator